MTQLSRQVSSDTDNDKLSWTEHAEASLDDFENWVDDSTF